MMPAINSRLVGILIASLCFYFNAMAVDIAVPSPDEMIVNSDIVVIGRFAETQANLFLVDEFLKAPVQTSKSLKVISPYSEMSFPIARFKSGLGQSPTILVGQWDANKQAVITIYGGCSFWPQGTPKAFLPKNTFDELRIFILRKIGH